MGHLTCGSPGFLILEFWASEVPTSGSTRGDLMWLRVRTRGCLRVDEWEELANRIETRIEVGKTPRGLGGLEKSKTEAGRQTERMR